MAVNQVQEIGGLKERMDIMFSFASKVSYKKNHLLPVLQASKSLIGMDINQQPRNLLKWLEKYIQNFQPDHHPPDPLKHTDRPKVLSIHRLEELIVNTEIEKSRDYLTFLIQTANPDYIMELLLEIAILRLRSISATLFCWSALKSIHFMSLQDSIGILFLSLDSLYHGQEGTSDENNVMDKFHLYCHLHQMKNTKMVRSSNLIPAILMQMKTLQDANNYNEIIPTELLGSMRENGEKGLVNYLLKLKLNKISSERIFLLDALRSAVRFARDKDNILSIIQG